MTALSKPLPIKKPSSPTKSIAVKASAKPATKAAPAKSTALKTPPIVAAKVVKPMLVSKTEKPVKVKKIKLVRDSFTIPKPEYLVLEELKLRAADLKHPVKKGELLRAGIKALAAMTNAHLLIALQAVPTLKTGRPSK